MKKPRPKKPEWGRVLMQIKKGLYDTEDPEYEVQEIGLEQRDDDIISQYRHLAKKNRYGEE